MSTNLASYTGHVGRKSAERTVSISFVSALCFGISKLAWCPFMKISVILNFHFLLGHSYCLIKSQMQKWRRPGNCEQG